MTSADPLQELPDLVNFLTGDRGRFGLILAVCSDYFVRDEVVAKTEAHLATLGRKVARCDWCATPKDADLLELLERAIPSVEGGADVVNVVNADHLIFDATGSTETTNALSALNFRRDALLRFVPAFVVFWLNNDAVVALGRKAPDLAQVVLATFRFTAAPRGVVIERHDDRPWHEFRLAVGEEVALRQREEALLSRLIDDPTAPPESVTDAMIRLGQVKIALGRGENAFALWDRAAERLRASGRSREVGGIHLRAALLREMHGELDAAQQEYEKARATFRSCDMAKSEAVAASGVADVLQARGEFDEALRIRREEELAVHERLGDVRERAVTMGKIADALQARGELDEALRIRRQEELPVYDSHADARQRAVTMGKIGDVLQIRGEFDEALRIRREEELPICERFGDARERAVVMGKIAAILHARGETREALRILRGEVLPTFDLLGDVRARAVTMGTIADLLQLSGLTEEALRIRRNEELPVYEKIGDIRGRAVAMSKIADILFRRGDVAEARRLLESEVLPPLERLGLRLDAAKVHARLAGIEARTGRTEDALRRAREDVLPAFTRMGLGADAKATAAFIRRLEAHDSTGSGDPPRSVPKPLPS